MGVSKINKVEPLVHFQYKLKQFPSRYGEILQKVKQEIDRTLKTFESCETRWKREVAQREEQLRLAEVALANCWRSNGDDCATARMRVSNARSHLQKANSELQNVIKWKNEISKQVIIYECQVRRLDPEEAKRIAHQLKIPSYQTYLTNYTTDNKERVSRIDARLLVNDNQNMRNSSNQIQVGKSGITGDEGGHWIAHRFGGSGELINLFPQNANLNRGEWKKMENEWANALDEHKSVEVGILPTYEGESMRPTMIEVIYKIENQYFEKVFFNEKEGLLQSDQTK